MVFVRFDRIRASSANLVPLLLICFSASITKIILWSSVKLFSSCESFAHFIPERFTWKSRYSSREFIYMLCVAQLPLNCCHFVPVSEYYLHLLKTS